jgi:ABC-type transporter Mla subunit MlaD
VLADNANQVLKNVDSVVSPANRQHLEAVLANMDALLADSRPRVKTTLANLETASAKLGPAVENANSTLTRTQTLATNLNAVIEENRLELHQALSRLRESLVDARRLVVDLDEALVSNRANLDETLENIRTSSQNLSEFTDTIRRRPFSLIRIKAQKDRVPPVGK